jgi:hypothetical protein
MSPKINFETSCLTTDNGTPKDILPTQTGEVRSLQRFDCGFIAQRDICRFSCSCMGVGEASGERGGPCRVVASRQGTANEDCSPLLWSYLQYSVGLRSYIHGRKTRTIY